MKRLKALRELRDELKSEVYLAGGSVRDLVRKQTPNDLDIVVRKVTPADFESFLRDRGELSLVGKSFGVYKFRPKRSRLEADIAFPRSEVSTGRGHRDFDVHTNPDVSLQDDSNRRDFTCNAMYVSLDDVDAKGKFPRNAVIDFHQGLDHIRKRLVVAVGNPEDRILEDPLRMLRAMVLIARTGYRLEGKTFAAIKGHVGLMASVAPERIGDEIFKIMESAKPSRAFRTMNRTNLLKEVFPELAACVGVGQNPKHHSYPVFEHSIYSADAACQLTDSLVVRFAALCHDLGKASTRMVKPGGTGPDDVSFHNHEIVSTRLAYGVLNRLRYPKNFITAVVGLVRLHQYKYDRTWTDKAVRRFTRKCGISRSDLSDLNNHPQFVLRQADRMGNDFKAHLPITQKQRDFQRRIIKVYGESSAFNLRDLAIDGNDVKESLGIPASPLVGRVMEFLFDVVEETPKINNRKDLLKIAEQYLKDLPLAGTEENHNSPREVDRNVPTARQIEILKE